MTDDSVALCGTPDREPALQTLRAGALEAVFDGAGLRWIRWRGIECVRGISFLVRDDGWRTPAARVSGLSVEETADSFTVRFTGDVIFGDAHLRGHVRYRGESSGRLAAEVDIEVLADAMTNRTGFVVLHALDGVAGAPVEVEHVDGAVEHVTLGATISPAQPLRDIRALTHEPAPGLRASVRMEGDTFEMEDQRNWTDASFKTYSRPLTLPFPYRLAKGETVRQSVVLTISDTGSGAAAEAGARAGEAVRVGDSLGARMPRIVVALPADRAAEALAVAAAIRDAAPAAILALVDTTQGHGEREIGAIKAFAEAVGRPVELHAVIAGQEEPSAELGRLAAAAKAAGLTPASVAAFPKVDEISFQPGQPRPPVPGLEAVMDAARSAFPGVPVGGGSPAFFPELNRKRPPADRMDFVTHGGCGIVHAADDASVMETLEAWPWIVRSARAFIGASRYRVAPSSIGARLNPYGAAPADNPGNHRVPLAQVDPRQRGLFAAAWHAGLVAAIAAMDVEEIAVGAPTGPFGIAFTQQDWPQPGFEEAGPGAVFPLWHVVAALGPASGAALRHVSAPAGLAALAWEGARGTALVVANRGTADREIVVEGLDPAARVRVLDVASFAAATRHPAAFRAGGSALAGPVRLGPYAVAFVEG